MKKDIDLSAFVRVSIDEYATDEGGLEAEIWARTLGCGCCSHSKHLTIKEALVVCDANIKKWEEKKRELNELSKKGVQVIPPPEP